MKFTVELYVITVVVTMLKIKQHRDCALVSSEGKVRYHELMRKFTEDYNNANKCKIYGSTLYDKSRVHRVPKDFITGSTFEGSWDILGMAGNGTYTIIHGGQGTVSLDHEHKQVVTYEGDFEDGMFHGEGQYHFECGAVLSGNWVNGKLYDRKLVYDDGLEYTEENWEYYRWPDRRYTLEYDLGLQPGGNSLLTNDQPSPEIPPGYYDTGIGFYHPIDNAIYKYDDLTAIIRAPSHREHKWIIDNCRRCPDDPVGPIPDLYEEWQVPLLVAEEVPPAPCRTNPIIDEDDIDNDYARGVSFSEVYFRRSRVSESHKRWKNRSLLRFASTKNTVK